MHKHVHKRRKITRAASWQQKGDVVRRIADEHKRAIAGAIRDAIAHFRRSIDLDEFKRQLKTGSHLGARGAFPRKKYEDALRKAFERMAQCYEDAAKAGAGQIHNLTLHSRRRRVRKADDPGHGGVYAFDRFTPAVQEALRVLQETFITTMSQDVADTVEQAVYDGMVNGWSADEIASEIRDSIGLNARQARAIDNYRSGLEAAGTYAPEEIDALVEARAETALDYRADMIARTESIRAANLGLHDGYQQAIVRGVFPQEAVRREWQIALDERTCEICIAIPDQNEGGVEVGEPFETDDGPIMDPPLHPNCIPGDSRITTCGGIAAVSKRWYDGNLVVIRTAAGHELSCTPNHPVLTDRGWVPARSLDVGGNVISSLGREWTPLRDLHSEDMPAKIHDVAEAVRHNRQFFSTPVPVAAKHFHGDGIGSEVAVVWTDRVLMSRHDPARGQEGGKFALVRRCTQTLFHDGLCALGFFFERMFSAASCFVCGGSLRSAFAGGHLRYLEPLPLAPRSRDDASFFESPDDSGAADARSVGKILYGNVAGPVAIDEIVHKRLIDFSGHVYNLETAAGFYIAEGIVTHNCRCSVTYVTNLDMVAQEDGEDAAAQQEETA